MPWKGDDKSWNAVAMRWNDDDMSCHVVAKGRNDDDMRWNDDDKKWKVDGIRCQVDGKESGMRAATGTRRGQIRGESAAPVSDR